MNKNYPMEEIEIAIKKTTNKSIRNMIICMALMLILCMIQGVDNYDVKSIYVIIKWNVIRWYVLYSQSIS